MISGWPGAMGRAGSVDPEWYLGSQKHGLTDVSPPEGAADGLWTAGAFN
jgi:hypothetical protein